MHSDKKLHSIRSSLYFWNTWSWLLSKIIFTHLLTQKYIVSGSTYAWTFFLFWCPEVSTLVYIKIPLISSRILKSLYWNKMKIFFLCIILMYRKVGYFFYEWTILKLFWYLRLSVWKHFNTSIWIQLKYQMNSREFWKKGFYNPLIRKCNTGRKLHLSIVYLAVHIDLIKWEKRLGVFYHLYISNCQKFKSIMHLCK